MSGRGTAGVPAPARQLALGVGLNATRRMDNFVTGDNAAVVGALAAVARGESAGHAYLRGAAGTGKTHLLQACCALAAARGDRVAYLPLADRGTLHERVLAGLERAALLCVDDVDRIASDAPWERAVFRLYNEAEAAGTRMLFAARGTPAALTLPDLASRLSAALPLRLAAPDDRMRAAVLRRRAEDLGIDLGEDVLSYVLARRPRDLGGLVDLVEALDRYALAAKRKVTVALVREYLDRAGQGLRD